MKLYGYFRSSAAYRIRIVLSLKGLEYEQEFVHLRKGENLQPGYLEVNPQGKVPALINGDDVLTQSMAIAEYLEEEHPTPALLPDGSAARARVRALCQAIACDIHPVNNLPVLNYLVTDMGLTEADKLRWYQHWISVGLGAFEAMLEASPQTGVFCHGDSPTLADAFLVPQIFNAARFDCDLSGYPIINRIEAACQALETFRAVHPDNQPDRE